MFCITERLAGGSFGNDMGISGMCVHKRPKEQHAQHTASDTLIYLETIDW